jgi:hypothetical protein
LNLNIITLGVIPLSFIYLYFLFKDHLAINEIGE